MSVEKKHGRTKRRKTMFIALAVLIFLLAAGAFSMWSLMDKPGSAAGSSVRYFTTRRGDLRISVTESGQVKALDVAQIKSQVEGQTTIIRIIPEGTEITAEDVANDLVLVELDASQFRENMVQQEISVAGAQSNYTEASEAYGIQVMQNESDINASLLNLRFALMDFQKYLGEDIANEVVGRIDPNSQGRIDPNAMDTVDATVFVNDLRLGGEALQRMRDLDSSISVADEQLNRARITLRWTEELAANDYATQTDVDADTFSVTNLEIQLAKAQLAKDLFLRYEFVKNVQQYLSDYIEATRQLARTQARARSQLAQAQARLISQQATLNLQQDRLAKTQAQIDACTIEAPAAGLVVYATSSNRWDTTRVEAGTAVRERQDILSITDTREMKVDIKVHEAAIHRVHVGQSVRITLDALADMEFKGEVLELAQLPDAQGWLGGDLKVYSGEASMLDADGVIKPGLSARVEIIIAELNDIVYVPVQAVVNRGGRKICYIDEGGQLKERPVETGQFNESFIEIVSGVQEGDRVCLTPPRLLDTGMSEDAGPSREN